MCNVDYIKVFKFEYEIIKCLECDIVEVECVEVIMFVELCMVNE